MKDGRDEQTRERADSILMDTEQEGRADTKAKRGKAHPATGTGKGPFSEAPFEVPRERESYPDGDRGPTGDGPTQETGRHKRRAAKLSRRLSPGSTP